MAVTLSSPKLCVRIAKADGLVSFETPGGEAILAEARPPVFSPVTMPFEKAFSVRQDFRLTPDEGLYGLGQHQDSVMNYRGRTVKLVQANTDAVTPFLVSTQRLRPALGQLLQDRLRGRADGRVALVGRGRQRRLLLHRRRRASTASSPAIGSSPAQAPMYGKWAYGYWQSKEHYHTQDELLAVAEEYRKRADPHRQHRPGLELLGRHRDWSGMFFDPERYPKPDGDGEDACTTSTST